MKLKYELISDIREIPLIYKATSDKEITLQELINFILERSNYGFIKLDLKNIIINCEYDGEKIKNENNDLKQFYDRKVNEIISINHFKREDWTITLKDVEFKGPSNELNKTINLMISNSFFDRLEGEYKQLQYRLKALEDLIQEAKELKFKYLYYCPIEIYKKQLSVMQEYKNVLEKRFEYLHKEMIRKENDK